MAEDGGNGNSTLSEEISRKVFEKRENQRKHILLMNSLSDQEKLEVGREALHLITEKAPPSISTDHLDCPEISSYLKRTENFWNKFNVLKERHERPNQNNENLRSVLKRIKGNGCSAKKRKVAFEEQKESSDAKPEDVGEEQNQPDDDLEEEPNKIVHEKETVPVLSTIPIPVASPVKIDNFVGKPDDRMEAKKQAMLAKFEKRRESLFTLAKDPKLSARKVTNKTNRNVIQNALKFSIFPGTLNEPLRTKVLKAVEVSSSRHFLALFRDSRLQYRAIYTWDEQTKTVIKLVGNGPPSCTEDMIDLMFKYDYGGKTFNAIPSKHFDSIIDGFTIQDNYWIKKPTATKP